VGWNSSSPASAIPMVAIAQDAEPTGDSHPSGPVVRDQARYPRTVIK